MAIIEDVFIRVCKIITN